MHTCKKKLCNNPRDVHFIEPVLFFSMWTGFETVHSYGVYDRIKINFCSEKDNLGKIHLHVMGEKKKKKKKKKKLNMEIYKNLIIRNICLIIFNS